MAGLYDFKDKKTPGAFDFAPRQRKDRTGLYRLWDNLVGIDDGVDTPGERLGKGLNSVGTAIATDAPGAVGGMANAVKGDLDNLMFEGGAMQRPEAVMGYAAGIAAPGAAPAGALRSGVARNAPSLNPAQAQAQEVIDMLKSGRGADVTDDMLAAADDMYLYNNYDLPMDEASRMGRAQEMGFDTKKTWYHGTPDNRGLIREGFATSAEQLNPSRERKGPYFLSDNRRVSDTYADDTRAFDYQGADPETLALYSRAQSPLTVDAKGDTFRGIEADYLEKAMRDKYGDGPMMDNFNLALDKVRRGEDEGRLSTDNLAAMASRFGLNDVVDVKRVRDTYTGDGPTSTVRMFSDPTSARRTSARFDPRLKNLANLSAAGAGAAYLGAQGSDQDQKAKIRAYLEGKL